VGNGIVQVYLDSLTANPALQPGMAMYVQNGSGAYSSVQVIDIVPPFSDAQGSHGWGFRFKQPPITVPFTKGAPVFCDIWGQQTAVIFENNVVEIDSKAGGFGLGLSGPFYLDDPLPPLDSAFVQANPVHGLSWNGPPLVPLPVTPSNPRTAQHAWLYQRVLIRDNFVRRASNLIFGGAGTQGIVANSCQSLIIENNVIGTLSSPPLDQYNQPLELTYTDTIFVKSFNNTWADGKPRQIFSNPHWYGNPVHWVDEIQTLADDVIWVFARKRRR
jgi:hypothetical protein